MENRPSLPEEWKSWQLVHIIGKGSSGTVWLAERNDGYLSSVSAVKIIPLLPERPEIRAFLDMLQSPETVSAYLENLIEQYKHEIALMLKLQGDSNIVSIQDYVISRKNEQERTIYIRMELLTCLEKYLETHTLAEKELLRLGISICSALEKCERLKICHRDVKPDNLFITQTGGYKLGDFGAAHHFDPGKPNAADAGTLLYMAPEVYRTEESDHRADIYSLGIVLYRLSNENFEPCMDRNTQIITRKKREQAFLHRMSAPAFLPAPCGASPSLARIILKACAFNPNERYQCARDMKKDLEKLLQE